MSQQNVEVQRAVYAEWGRGNFRAGPEIFDPQIVLILRPEFPDAGNYLGAGGVARYMRGFLSAWTELTITGKEFIEAGDTVVVAVHQRGVGVESGTPVELPYFQVWTFRGRAVIRLESVRDRAEALQAAGMAE